MTPVKTEDGWFVVGLSDGSEVPTRSIVIATGADPRIIVVSHNVVSAVHGVTKLERVTFEHTTTGALADVDVRAMFCFIGAVPATAWLGECIRTDADGFVLTDRDLGDLSDSTLWRAVDRDPLPYETSSPGMFAVGDVRAGSIKRVAAAIGEGSACVRSVHEHLSLRE